MAAGSSFFAPTRKAMTQYINKRRTQPHFANARSIRNALDRRRLRQANRVFEMSKGPIDVNELSIIRESDVRNSRVFDQKEESK